MIYGQKTIRLADACDIRTGYSARTRLDPVEGGGVPAIQLRDLRGEGEFDPDGSPLYALDGKIERYLAGPGDVLFRSRGEQNTAVVIASSAKAAVAVLPLLVLRPNCGLVDPRYLAWFINQPATQRYFDSCARGTGLRMIPKSCLENLELSLPDLPTQQLVVEIDKLSRRESELLVALAAKKRALTSFALLRQMRNAQPHGNGTGRMVVRRDRNPAGKSERTNS
jgi:hypothetical protein